MSINLPARLVALPPRWRWTLHNLIAHPLSDAIHDGTIPAGGATAPDARG